MTASIGFIKSSDGSGNASVATVQSIRSGGATTIAVNTVLGMPAKFAATMGTPHTFTDPVTSETITVISEATAVDFFGHIDGSDIEIDAIAPGYTDAGSEVGDIIIIRPTTQWANNVAEVLEVAHDDDGTLKDDSVTEDVVEDDAVTPVKRSGGFFSLKHSFGSGTGSKSITGVGFKPKCIIVQARDRASGSELVSVWGKAVDNIGSITQAGGASYGVPAANQGYTFQSSTSAFIGAAGSSIDFEAAVTSFDADGITVDVSNGSATGQVNTFEILFLA